MSIWIKLAAAALSIAALAAAGAQASTLYAAPGVPEPAAWALLLMGFGSLGMALPRQRQLQPVAVRA